MEIWKTLKDREGYEISNTGLIRSKERYITKKNGAIQHVPQCILKTRLDWRGYPCITIRKGGTLRGNLVHRLLAEAFIPNPENKPFINHINGIKNDNRIENLEWCTAKENSRHAVKLNLMNSPVGERAGNNKLTELEVREIFHLYKTGDYSTKLLGKMYEVNRKTISCIINGINWKHLNLLNNGSNSTTYVG